MSSYVLCDCGFILLKFLGHWGIVRLCSKEECGHFWGKGYVIYKCTEANASFSLPDKKGFAI